MRPEGEITAVLFASNNHRKYRSPTTNLYGCPRFALANLGLSRRAKPLLAFRNRETKLSSKHLKLVYRECIDRAARKS
jgi:hypothetical protein